MHIRKALAFEYEQLSKIALQSKAFWGYDEAFMRACEHELLVSQADLTNPIYTYWVLQQDDTIAGYCALKPLNDQQIELDALFVKPNFMCKGYGAALFKHVVPLLQASSYQQLIILSDPQASGFYEQMGATFHSWQSSQYIEGRKLPLYKLKI